MTTDPVKGKTLRWSYEDGPTAGKTFEHDFGDDGRVRYRFADGAGQDGGDGSMKGERPKYEVASINDDVFAVSYLAPSGYTLTSVLDAGTGTIVSFASNEKELVIQHGTFEVREPATRS
jgi:hypothetical protein